jgi:hypothetical protein
MTDEPPTYSYGPVQCQAPGDWVPCRLVPLCALNCSVEHISAKLGGDWTEDVEDGLGRVLLMALAQDGSSRYVLSASAEPEALGGIVVEADANVDPVAACQSILRALGLTSADFTDPWYVTWSHRPGARADAGEPRWTLWRQDDHGNVVAVRDFSTREAAAAECARLEAAGHRQTYWVAAKQQG